MLKSGSASQLSRAAYAVYVGGGHCPPLPSRERRETGHKQHNIIPAMQAVRKQAMVPAISALIAPAVMSCFLEGAMEPGEHGRKYERSTLRILIKIPNSLPLRVLGLESLVS